MSSITGLRLAALGLAFIAIQPARASDLGGFSVTVPIVGGEKEGKDDHAREVVPARPDFALWDNGKTIKPHWVNTIFTIERAEQGRLLIKGDGQHAYRGWVSSRDVVPLNQAESFFSAAIQADGGKAFPYLMRGVSGYISSRPIGPSPTWMRPCVSIRCAPRRSRHGPISTRSRTIASWLSPTSIGRSRSSR